MRTKIFPTVEHIENNQRGARPPKFYEDILDVTKSRLNNFGLRRSYDNAYMVLVGSVDGSFPADISGEHRNLDNKLMGVQIKPNLHKPEQSTLNKFLEFSKNIFVLLVNRKMRVAFLASTVLKYSFVHVNR